MKISSSTRKVFIFLDSNYSLSIDMGVLRSALDEETGKIFDSHTSKSAVLNRHEEEVEKIYFDRFINACIKGEAMFKIVVKSEHEGGKRVK